LGRRYTTEEIQQIQALIDEGLTNREIATKLSRSEAGIRNIRHRTKIKTNTTKSLQILLQNDRELKAQASRLQSEIETLTTRRDKVLSVLRTGEQALNQRLQIALIRLKDEKPELFEISLQEQIGKIAAEFTIDFLKWIVS